MLASAVGCAQTKIVIPLVTMDTSVEDMPVSALEVSVHVA